MGLIDSILLCLPTENQRNIPNVQQTLFTFAEAIIFILRSYLIHDF